VSLDPGLLLFSLVTSGAGYVLFTYGRKQDRMPHLLAGIVYMVYPYFVNTLIANVAVAAILAVGLWITVRAGY
jgi:hypothetical protein